MCTQVGSNVVCTGTTFNYDSGAQANLAVTVQAGANVIGNNGNDAVRITSITTATLTNNGLIDGFVTILSGNPGSDTFTNNGILKITDPTEPLQEHSMVGTNFIQTANGTFFARVDSNLFFDGIFSQSANLNGKLIVVVQPGLYDLVTTYDQFINTLTGTVGGFSSIETNSPFFSAITVVNGNDLDLVLSRVGFGSVTGMTPNQRAVGNALEGSYATTLTGNAATLYSNLLAANSVTVLDNISGEGTSGTQHAAFGAGSLFNNAMQNQALFGGGLSVIVPPTAYTEERVARGHEAFAFLKAKALESQPGRWRIWAAGFGAARSFDGESSTGSSNQSIRNFGGAFGFDHQAGPDLIVGISVGGSESNFSVPNLSTSGQVTGGHLGLYGVKSWGAYYAAAAVSYARFDNSTARDITGVGPSEFAKGRFASDQVSARLELGWKHAYAHYTLTPFVAVEPAALWQRGYTESSTTAGGAPGILGLDVSGRTATSVPTFVGLQADTRTVLPNGAVLTPFARASWVHEFMPDRRVTAAFVTVPTAAFTVDGARAARDTGRLDAGAKLALGSGETLFANLAGEWSSRSQSYAATAGFRLAR